MAFPKSMKQKDPKAEKKALFPPKGMDKGSAMGKAKKMKAPPFGGSAQAGGTGPGFSAGY